MERTACDSECAASIGYGPERRILEVEYRDGGVYRYHDLPPDERRRLRQADRIGRHLNRDVKPQVPMREGGMRRLR